MAKILSADSNTSIIGSNQKEDWKADRFINISLPTKNGGRKQIGSIKLKLSDKIGKQLIEILDEDEDKLALLVNKFEFSYNSADSTTELDLDF